MSSQRPAKGCSGEHPAVIAFREKLDSIQDHTVPAAEELTARIARLRAKSGPPIKRTEDGDEPIPIDTVYPEKRECLPKK